MEGWGGQWYNPSKKRVNVFSDPFALAGIEEMISAAEMGFLYPFGKSNLNEYEKLGTADYIFNQVSSSELKKVSKEYESKGIDWDIASFPKFPHSKAGVVSSGLVVHNKTRCPDMASALALFFYTENGQIAFHGEKGGTVPVHKSLAGSDFWKNRESSCAGKNMDAFVSFPELDTVGIIKGRLPSEVASIIEDSWEKMLKQHFDGYKHFADSLYDMERKANELWETLDEADS
jgi:ABC-type glycerol-3-phosphate transport system substrate-binding protein